MQWHRFRNPILQTAAVLAAFTGATSASAQNRPEPDRSDPAVLEREIEEQAPAALTPQIFVDAPRDGTAPALAADFVVGAVRVTGTTRMSTAAFAPSFESFLGRPLSRDDLVALASAVANIAREDGYGLATAWIPAQSVANGVLEVRVDEGRIDAVRTGGPAASMVQQRLERIATGQPIRTAELERELMLAGDAAGIWVGDARLVRERGRNILEVQTRYQRVQGRVTIDNWGSSSVGPVRAWADMDARGVALRGDEVSLGVGTTPFEPDTFQLVEAHYRLPLGGRGTTLSVGGYYGHTDVEPEGNSGGFVGDSWEIEVEARHALVRSRRTSLWLSGSLELRESDLDRRGIPVRDDRIASVTGTLYGYDRFAGGRLWGRLSVVQGLDIFGATEFGDPLASRADADGVFTKVEVRIEWWRWLGSGFSTQVAARAQIADGPLLSSEEMGLGGPDFLRAFDYREQSGDGGIVGSVELRYDLKDPMRGVDKVQIYGFADAGHVGNQGPNGRSGSLASAGGGVRFEILKDFEVGLEVGLPLTDGDNDNDPDPRFSFSVRARF